MSRLSKAIKLAAEVHDGQVDKGGEDYILHALAVMHKVNVDDLLITENREDLQCVAVLHDVIEDHEPRRAGEHLQLLDYIKTSFGDRVYDALQKMSKLHGETYTAYIDNVASDWIARRVKIADLTHNMDTGRLPEGEIEELDFKRWDKYRRALVRLKRED